MLVSFSFKGGRHQRRRQFKFEASWNIDAECAEIVNSSWQGLRVGGSAIQEVCMKLTSCQHALTRWSVAKYCNSRKAITEKTKQLATLKKDEEPGSLELIKSL